MRFVAREVKEGVNVSKTHPLLEAGTLLVGLGVLFTGLAVMIVFLVELGLYYVSPEDEAELFENWLPNDLITVDSVDDGRVATQALLDRLVSHWPESPYDYRVEIDASDVANAMAFPGGLIIVTAGLLRQAETENELAFVLGHELGHFRNRDHLRALGRGVVLSMFMALVTGGDTSGLSVGIADLTLRGFGRKQETAADEFGLELVYAEYGHVNEAWRLFERWKNDERNMLGELSYLSTHPDTGDRIDDLRRFAAANAWPTSGELTPFAPPQKNAPQPWH